jgi:hypothetical protein
MAACAAILTSAVGLVLFCVFVDNWQPQPATMGTVPLLLLQPIGPVHEQGYCEEHNGYQGHMVFSSNVSGMSI